MTGSRTLNLDAFGKYSISQAEFQNYDCDKSTTQCDALNPLPGIRYFNLPSVNVKEYECKSNVCKTICEKGYLK